MNGWRYEYMNMYKHTEKWLEKFQKGGERELSCFKHHLCAQLC